jgi:hypothetical protein
VFAEQSTMSVERYPGREFANRSSAHPRAAGVWDRLVRWAILTGFAATLGLEGWLLYRAWQLWFAR